MTDSMSVRAATPEDVDRLQEIREQVSLHLIERGVPWSPNVTEREHIESWVSQGTLWVATLAERIAGMTTVWWTDPTGHWKGSDLAAYVHDLMIDPALQGERIGERLLGWVEAFARGRGRRLVRLDCAASNARLCRYYEDLRYRRVAESGDLALFEKRL